jgi:hypothetical protein
VKETGALIDFLLYRVQTTGNADEHLFITVYVACVAYMLGIKGQSTSQGTQVLRA